MEIIQNKKCIDNKGLNIFKCKNCNSSLFSSNNLDYYKNLNHIDVYIPENEDNEKEECIYLPVNEDIKNIINSNFNIVILDYNKQIICNFCKNIIGINQIENYGSSRFEYLKFYKSQLNEIQINSKKSKTKISSNKNIICSKNEIKVYDMLKLKESDTINKIVFFLDYFNKNIKPLLRSSMLKFRDLLDEVLESIKVFVVDNRMNINTEFL